MHLLISSCTIVSEGLLTKQQNQKTKQNKKYGLNPEIDNSKISVFKQLITIFLQFIPQARNNIRFHLTKNLKIQVEMNKQTNKETTHKPKS